MLLGGCAVQERIVAVPKPVLVTPSCEPANMLERCRAFCVDQPGQAAIGAPEDETTFRCICAPFGA